ncbi:hypothetical protein COLO4_33447 [Corchorus olitorius]|uniref:Uncharacterized protein n=1 Tax=Corchorus olitorius TaxID=93759 RepID=A0A1R3GTB1_9ROSI|nr:hypothetical protein COLO4_33447 [Corchorus olitorius]
MAESVPKKDEGTLVLETNMREPKEVVTQGRRNY